jgi:hypothetical protein
MPTDQQIATMCDIARSGGGDLKSERLPDVLALIDAGYLHRSDDSIERYALTDKGQELLDDRGVGVNEG